MIGLRIRYKFSELMLRTRGFIQVKYRYYFLDNVFRSSDLVSSFVSMEDARARNQSQYLALILGHSHIYADQLCNVIMNRMGTGYFRIRHISDAESVKFRIAALFDVEIDNAWELTFAIARVRDLARSIPGGGKLARTLADAHDLARMLALAGVDTSMRLFIVRLSALPRILMSLTLRLLPRTHRDRFKAEFCAEMYELYPSVKRQVGYAARQLLCSFMLRRALREIASEPQKDVS